MSKYVGQLDQVSLGDLVLGPPQVLGGVRLVPLLRDDIREDLRLTKRTYGEELTAVRLPDKSTYYHFVPHALVADWTSDGMPVSSFGTQIKKHKPEKTSDGRAYDCGFMTARVMSKVRAREKRNRLRFLPLDMSLEGLLSLHFGGPNIAWEEYSRLLLQHGLGSRSEQAYPGRWIIGLEDALRVFEIHPNQVGVLVFVADALASVFVVPHPLDYLALHRTLITDSFGELIYIYGFQATENVFFPEPIDSTNVNSLDDLRDHLGQLRSAWSELHAPMLRNLFDCPILSEQLYKMGPFQMQRFISELDPKGENHIGETITRNDGRIEYMKSFRLSGSQTRRAYLLQQLAESEWELEACAQKMSCTKNQLVFRLQSAGFGYFLHQHVLDAARAQRRRQSK